MKLWHLSSKVLLIAAILCIGGGSLAKQPVSALIPEGRRFGPELTGTPLWNGSGLIAEIHPAKKAKFESLVASRNLKVEYIDPARLDERDYFQFPSGDAIAPYVRSEYLVAFLWDVDLCEGSNLCPKDVDVGRIVDDQFGLAHLINDLLQTDAIRRINVVDDAQFPMGGIFGGTSQLVHVDNRRQLFLGPPDPDKAHTSLNDFLLEFFRPEQVNPKIELTSIDRSNFKYVFRISGLKNVVMKGFNYWEEVDVSTLVMPRFNSPGVQILVDVEVKHAPGSTRSPPPTKFRTPDNDRYEELVQFTDTLVVAMTQWFNL
jgi:hypothetical protein